MKFIVRAIIIGQETDAYHFSNIVAISEGGGTIWTQLILMTRSPIIGLSATVGDAATFNAWLESVQIVHGVFLVLQPYFCTLKPCPWKATNTL